MTEILQYEPQRRWAAAARVGDLLYLAGEGSGDLWPHLAAYVLPVAIRDTMLLLLGVGVLVILVGVGAAWLVTAYDFPLRRVFDWALLLPLAVLGPIDVERRRVELGIPADREAVSLANGHRQLLARASGQGAR